MPPKDTLQTLLDGNGKGKKAEIISSRQKSLFLQFKTANMQEDKSQLINYAMRCGLYLGVFWIIKYLFLMGSSQIPALAVPEVIFRLGTPLLLFYFLVKYRTSILDNNLGYWHGVQFAIMLFFFASILEAVIIFAHTTWINPSYISDIYSDALAMAKEMGMNGQMTDMLELQQLPSPISYTFSNMMSDVLLGLISALILVPVSKQFNFNDKQNNDRYN